MSTTSNSTTIVTRSKRELQRENDQKRPTKKQKLINQNLQTLINEIKVMTELANMVSLENPSKTVLIETGKSFKKCFNNVPNYKLGDKTFELLTNICLKEISFEELFQIIS